MLVIKEMISSLAAWTIGADKIRDYTWTPITKHASFNIAYSLRWWDVRRRVDRNHWRVNITPQEILSRICPQELVAVVFREF